MDRQTLINAKIDYENGKNRFAGNEALYEKYLLKFKDDPHFEGAKAAFAAEDYEKLLKETHALKGVAGTLGIIPVYQASAGIVSAIRAEEVERVPQLYQTLVSSYEHIVQILK